MKIELFGEIVSDEWLWIYQLFGIPCCCPGQVRQALADLPAGEELIVEINSPGGDVWAGFEIFGLLQACPAHTEAHIISMAASAATTAMCGCDTVLASPVAQIMVHQPRVGVDDYINNTGARQLQNFLDSVKASILNGYMVKCAGKASRAELEALVDSSTWMPVQDAIDLGLVDGLLDTDEELEALLAKAGGVVVRNAAGLSPAPKALLDRYEAAVKAGTMQEVPGHPVSKPAQAPTAAAEDLEIVNSLVDNWKLVGALELERARGVL